MPTAKTRPSAISSRHTPSRFVSILVLSLAFLLCASSSGVGADSTAGDITHITENTGNSENTDTAADSPKPYKKGLLPYMQSAFACTQRIDTNHHLFHGCIDWHSAVHGHWAVLRHANLVERTAEADIIVNSLQSLALAQERRFMSASPGFEMPYGRAWFLALTLEYEQLTDDEQLAAMAHDMAMSLRAFLGGQTIKPLTREYGNHSWVLAQLLRYYRARDDNEGKGWVAAQVDAHYLDYDPAAALLIDHSRPDFFSLWGNWSMLLGLHNPTILRNWLQQQAISEAALKPITNPKSSHQLGINASRAWGLWWAFLATNDARFEQASSAHRLEMAEVHQKLQASYGSYGHWVPQFAIYANTQPID